MKPETITIDGREYRKFIPYPAVVADGTCRCITCGQIDEEPYHDPKVCAETRRDILARQMPRSILEREALKLGAAQRRTVLALAGDEWGKAPDHGAAKRLWYRELRLVDHKHATDNCWALTDAGVQMQAYLRARGE